MYWYEIAILCMLAGATCVAIGVCAFWHIRLIQDQIKRERLQINFYKLSILYLSKSVKNDLEE